MRIEVPESNIAKPAGSLWRHAPDLATAMFAYSDAVYLNSKLSLREFEAARIRTAHINGCMVCRSFRAARDLKSYLAAAAGPDGPALLSRGPAPDEALYANILDWREATNYSARERVAIEFAERLGLDPAPLAYDDEFWTRAKALFSDAEIADLAMSIGAWMAGGRVVHALGLDTVCAAGPAEELAA